MEIGYTIINNSNKDMILIEGSSSDDFRLNLEMIIKPMQSDDLTLDEIEELKTTEYLGTPTSRYSNLNSYSTIKHLAMIGGFLNDFE